MKEQNTGEINDLREKITYLRSVAEKHCENLSSQIETINHHLKSDSVLLNREKLFNTEAILRSELGVWMTVLKIIE